MAANELPSPDTDAGWGAGASKRFLGLAAARALTQVVALGWFLLAARLLSDREFGIVATGLAFFAIFAGVGDVGTTRTVVRYVAADPRTLWISYRRAVRMRIAGGIATAAVTAAAVAIFAKSVDPVVVLLAGAMATASGVTELAYAGLRSVGRVRVEMVTLVLERTLFVAVAWPALAAGAGPKLLLAVYVGTNALSGIVAGLLVRRAQPPEVREPGPMADREARRTALAFALVTVSPRVSAVVLALAADAKAVAIFTVAQRPVEAATLFAMSTAAPVLPIVRARITQRREEAAFTTARAVLGGLSVALAPLVAWWIVAPRQVLDVLVGAGRYRDAGVVLALVAATTLTWSLRGIGEFLLLAQERAGRFLRITTIGLLVNVVIGFPLARAAGARGAAVALVVAEVVMTVMLLRLVPGLWSRATGRVVGRGFALGAAAALSIVPLRGHLSPALALMALWLAIAAVLASRSLRPLGATA